MHQPDDQPPIGDHRNLLQSRHYSPVHDQPGLDDLDLHSLADQGLPRPVNWEALSPADLEVQWYALDGWVTWLRHTYGLPAAVLPPAWHRHPELVWELSALHLHWLGSYHPDQHASAPLGWHRDLAEAIQRLRDWTAASGTGLDHDRDTRPTPWPGEPADTAQPTQRPLHDRAADFHAHVAEQVANRSIQSAAPQEA